MDSLIFCGAGKGGVDELQVHLKHTSVQWALLRVSLGSGCFRRDKTVFLHMNGAKCPAVARWRANELTRHAQRVFTGEGESFLSLEVTHIDDVTPERILARIRPMFVVDNCGDHECGWTEREKVKPRGLRRRVTEPAFPSDRQEPRVVMMPRLLLPHRFASGRDALRSVADARGVWNWLVVGPDPSSLPLVGGGSGSVGEMCDFLHKHRDTVLFGLVRLSFGTGRLRCVKHVFVHAIGELVSAVKRGLMSGKRAAIERAMSDCVTWTTTFEMTRLKDFTVEALIDRVKRTSSLDNSFLEGDTCRFSLQSYRQAQTEETPTTNARASPQKPAAVSAPRELQKDFVVDSLVKLLHVPSSDVNWILLSAKGLTDAEVDEEVALGHCREMLRNQTARRSSMWTAPKSVIAEPDSDTDTDDTRTDASFDFSDDDTDIE